VSVRGQTLILQVESPGVARWVDQRETHEQLRALLARHIDVPSRWRLSAEAVRGDDADQRRHKLRRRLEDFKLGTARSEWAADDKLAGGFLLSGEGARPAPTVEP
jgi:hypothetical protein